MPIPEYIRALRTRIGTALLEVPTAAVIAFDAERRVLLARHAESGLWTAPGGLVEPRETPADAAVRETWEETGVLVELTRIVGVFGGPACAVRYRNGDELAWVATVFEARPLRGSPRADGEEISEAGYFARDAIGSLRCRKHLRMFLDAAFDATGRTWFEPPKWVPEGR